MSRDDLLDNIQFNNHRLENIDIETFIPCRNNNENEFENVDEEYYFIQTTGSRTNSSQEVNRNNSYHASDLSNNQTQNSNKVSRVYKNYNSIHQNILVGLMIEEGKTFIGKKPQKRNKHKMDVKKEKKPRKFFKDCIHKKIKVHLLKFIKDHLNKGLQKYFPLEKKFNNLEQATIINITIHFNSNFLEKTVYQVYSGNITQSDFDTFGNNNIIEKLRSIEEYGEFVNTPLYQIFNNFYLNSESFKKLIKKLQSDEDYCNLYKKLANNFIHYFRETKPNKTNKNV
jgi:hypothetical protein